MHVPKIAYRQFCSSVCDGSAHLDIVYINTQRSPCAARTLHFKKSAVNQRCTARQIHQTAECNISMCAAVDWQQWTEDERRAALSQVLIPRNREDILNHADFEDTGPNRPRQIALRSSKAAAENPRTMTENFLRCNSSAEASVKGVGLGRSDSAGSCGGRLSRGRLVSSHGDVVHVSCKGISSKARAILPGHLRTLLRSP